MDDFEAFWKEYPKRSGPQNKSGARSSFERRVKQGADPKKIIAATRVYAIKRDWAQGKGRYEKAFLDSLIPMAQTWLNQKRYEDPDYQPTAPAMSEEEINRRIAEYKEKWARA